MISITLAFVGIGIVALLILCWLIYTAFPLPNVKSRGFISNAYKFRKQLKEYRSWDSACIADFAADMYRDMADYIEKEGCHVGKEKTVRRARVIAHLLDTPVEMSKLHEKLLDEWWSSRTETGRDGGCTLMEFTADAKRDKLLDMVNKHEDSIRKHRKELLLKYLRKYHSRIWD